MTLQSKKIFIDSSVLIAFIDRADANHAKVVKIMESLAQNRYHLYTSTQVISDVYSSVSREIGVSVALDFLQASLQSQIEIIFPQKADLITANRMIRSNRERQLTLREVVNATLMQRKGVTQILTFTFWHNLFGSFVSNLAL